MSRIRAYWGSVLVACVVFFMQSPVDAEKEWQEYKCQHFLIYYNQSPLEFVKNVEEMAEHYYDKITDALDVRRSRSWVWTQRAKIYIYDDQDDYVARGRNLQWSHGSAFARDKIIRTFPSAHGFFDSTLPHELGHIIFRELIGFEVAVPLWFEEGVAMYQEKAQRWGSHKIVRDALKTGKFIPLSQLELIHFTSDTPREIVELFYAEAASVVNYLIVQRGQPRFTRFCMRIKEKTPFEWAIAEVYSPTKNVEMLNTQWMKYLNK